MALGASKRCASQSLKSSYLGAGCPDLFYLSPLGRMRLLANRIRYRSLAKDLFRKISQWIILFKARMPIMADWRSFEKKAGLLPMAYRFAGPLCERWQHMRSCA